jgi:hypothetical protein
VARCKIYEIQGPDPSRTAGAVRCHREAVDKITIDDHKFNICKKHAGKGWAHFVADGWPYAVDIKAPPVKKKRKS